MPPPGAPRGAEKACDGEGSGLRLRTKPAPDSSYPNAERRSPKPGCRRVGLDPGDVPPPEIGGVEPLAVERDVGRVAERVRGRVLDVDLDPARAVEPQDARGLVA